MIDYSVLDVSNLLLKEMFEVFKVFWSIDELRELIVGAFIWIIAFPIVGLIFNFARSRDIWFGRVGGKLIYFIVSGALTTIIMKLT